MTPTARAVVVAGLVVLTGPGCAYYNTLHNARAKFNEAQDIKKTADPERERISNREETLYDEAIEKAAKVVKFYPDSKWVDDALLLMGKAAFESGEYSTAARKFDEVLALYPDSDLVPETLLWKGRTHVATKEYPQAIEVLKRADGFDKKEIRAGVRYYTGTVQAELDEPEEALASFVEVIEKHRGSEWFAEAGLRAGSIAEERGDLEAAVGYYDKVSDKADTWTDRFRGGMRMGAAYLAAGEYEKAKKAYRDVAGNSPNDEDKGAALLAWGDVHVAEGDIEEARKIYARIMKEYPLSEASANAQLAIARTWDDAGDLERAALEYENVREQGSGFDAWQIASKRMTVIQAVIDLRLAIEKDDDNDRERKRYLLAEQLLEDIGDVDAALIEYATLAEEAFGTEWGAKALFAEAWVLEHRKQDPDSAAVKFHRLANYYSGTDPDRYARRRLGYPVWNVEIIDVPPVRFIVPENADTEPEDIVLSRAEPRDVPLPPGVSQVEVWIRLNIGDDGRVESTKIVRSGGEEFDAAVVEAAEASAFLAPSAGGPRITVARYQFPPPPETAPEETPAGPEADGTLPEGAAPGEETAPEAAAGTPAIIEGSAAGLSASLPDSLVAPDSLPIAPVDTSFSTTVPNLRGRTFEP